MRKLTKSTVVTTVVALSRARTIAAASAGTRMTSLGMATAILTLGAFMLVAPVRAESLSPTSLTDAGWSCVPTPPFIVPTRIVCATPGLGRPTPGTPDRPSYHFLEFGLDGSFLGTETLIRQDLYAGEPCGPGGDPYIFRAPIGYYACFRD